jgi:alpha-glucosidase
VFSNHDVVRHPTRYGLLEEPETSGTSVTETGAPMAGGAHDGKGWLLAGAPEHQLNRDLGLARAKAATLLMLALPGSAYLYQGEELGLHEVAEIPDAQRQDPAFFRNPGVDIGRDGCRVPLPWNAADTAFGFSTTDPHLPQPQWFTEVAADMQEEDPESTLNLYRKALSLRRILQGPEELRWIKEESSQVLHFARPGGWHSITNFGDTPVPLSRGLVLLSSGLLPDDGTLPPATTVWMTS